MQDTTQNTFQVFDFIAPGALIGRVRNLSISLLLLILLIGILIINLIILIG